MIVQIDPILVNIGPFPVRWYGLMYIIGLGLALLFAWWRIKKQPWRGWNSTELGDLTFYAAVGVILGGRIGYLLFYGWARILEEPSFIFRVWEGGMSFHGGLLGVLVAMWIYAKLHKRSFVAIMDFIVPFVPLGLATGRLGNFINGELWGKPTDVAWGMIFPSGGMVARHPTQLYEFALEGVVMFVVLMVYSHKLRPRYAVSGLFLILYGAFRVLVEFFRIPDTQIGYLAFDWLTMGQILSIPMLLLGLWLMVYAYRTKPEQN